MPRIYIFLPYFGKFPNYFQLYLDSLKMNKDILTVFLITDIDLSSYCLPPNLIVAPMTIDDVRKRAANMLLSVFNRHVSPGDLIKTNYKLVDFKVTFPIMFNDLVVKHGITETDFVGFGDCDLIYGKISNFLKFENNYHIIGGWHGHLIAFINTESFKLFFKDVPRFCELCVDNSKTFITDEIACRETLKGYIKKNNYNMFFTNLYFCDIVPPCFYYLFRPDHAKLEKNYFDVYNHSKNIKQLYYTNNQKLTVFYDDGSEREVLYCHLQKRAMTLPFTEYVDGYYIQEHGFAL